MGDTRWEGDGPNHSAGNCPIVPRRCALYQGSSIRNSPLPASIRMWYCGAGAAILNTNFYECFHTKEEHRRDVSIIALRAILQIRVRGAGHGRVEQHAPPHDDSATLFRSCRWPLLLGCRWPAVARLHFGVG